MIILVDTDVVLDLLLDRAPFAHEAVELFSRIERGDATGYLCATTFLSLCDIAARSASAARSRKALKRLLALVETAPITRTVIESALEGAFSDFEKEILCEAAYRAGARAIVTRAAGDYQGSRVPAYLPGEMLEILRARDELGE